jgi:DnaJ-class molecular chaperone
MNKIDIKLNPGEIICDKCHGIGNYGYTKPNRNMRSYPKICSKCSGRGRLDWIENIIGVKPGFCVLEVDLTWMI